MRRRPGRVPGRARRLLPHLRPQDAHGGAREPARLRRRAERPRPVAEQHDRAGCRGCSRTSSRSRACWPRATTAWTASSASSATPRASSRRSPTATRTPSRRAPTRSRRGRATPTGCAQTIRDNAPTMRTGIRSFRVQRPFLRDIAAFSRALRDATAVMPTALPRIDDALETGIPVVAPHAGDQRGAPADARRAGGARPATRRRSTRCAASRGSSTSSSRSSASSGPYVTVCNYFNYSFTHLGEHITEPDPTGYSQRTLLNQFPRTRDPTDPSMGSIGARTPLQRRAGRLRRADELPRRRVRGGDRARRQGRLRVRPARLRREAHALRQEPEPQDRDRPAHARATSGPTFTGRPQRPRGSDVHAACPSPARAFPPELDKP